MIQKGGVHLSCSKEAIVTAPGANSDPEHYVESERGSPYVVKHSKRYGFYYECDGNCISYAAYNLCSHIIAVAELEGNAEQFINLYKLNKHGSANISTLSQIDLPSGREKERTKSTEVRKGATNSNKGARTVVQKCIEPTSSPVVNGNCQTQPPTQIVFINNLSFR